VIKATEEGTLNIEIFNQQEWFTLLTGKDDDEVMPELLSHTQKGLPYNSFIHLTGKYRFWNRTRFASNEV